MERVVTRLSLFFFAAAMLAPFAVQAQDVCYVQQQLCNESCAGDTLCRIRTCFKEAVECQKRLDEQAQKPQQIFPEVAPDTEAAPVNVDPRPAFRQPPRRNQLPTPKTYVLPPIETCASLSWQGDRLVEFTATNNCPAAIDADVLFSDGTRVAVYCDGYDSCTASFPKVKVSDQFQYWLRYATEDKSLN